MTVQMKGKSLITLKDLSTDEIRFLLDEAKSFKENRVKIAQKRFLEGKTLGMIFEKDLPVQESQPRLPWQN